MSFRIEFYTNPQGVSWADEFLDEMPEKHRAKAIRWLDALAKEGPNLPRPYADVVEGKIRELRMAFAHHEYRLLYFFHGRMIVITHGFVKKTSHVPQTELLRAQRAMTDWLVRYGYRGGEAS